MGDLVSTDFSLFKGRKVFITGHTGFKGSWLTRIMLLAGSEVCGYALPAPEQGLFRALNLSGKIRHQEADIRNAENLKKAVSEFRPDIVFHLAAQAIVAASYRDPAATFDTNIMGSVNLLDAVRACDSVQALVYITSDKCYENLEWVWGYRENDRLGGHDPYSASKAAAELVFSSYVRSFLNSKKNLGAASARAGNVIGGGDWSADRIVPDCIRAAASGGTVTLRNPQATRPWQHVLEPVSGYIRLAEKLLQDPARYSGSWNFGPDSSEVRTVLEVAGRIMEHYGKGRVVADASSATFHEANLLQLNCDKAAQLLQWQPRWDVETTLKKTAEWYRLQAAQPADAGRITDDQIADFFPELKKLN